MDYEELEESEPRFRELAETVPGALWVHDIEDYQVLYVSPGYERIWGRPRELIYANPRDWIEAIHPDDRGQVEAAFDRVLESHGELEFDAQYRIVRPDGQIRWVHDRGAPVGDRSGKPCRMVGLAEDITDKKRAELARTQAQEKERESERRSQAQKLESLSVLAGGVAHDFNNLLMGVLGNADIALARLPLDSPVRGRLQEIERAAKRAAELCRQMLAYSGKGRFVVEYIDLREVVEEMARLMEARSGNRARIEFDFAEDLPSIEGDSTQIRQVVMNLITNASEAIGEQGGVITAACGVMECGRAYLDGTFSDDDLPEGHYVYLEVSDTGCGMDAETIEKTFDPFFSTKFAGRGLGLAAVQGIVRGHEGAIHVESEPGEGTSFRLLFPPHDSPAAPVEEGEHRETTWRVEGTALLVDDDDTARAVGASLLSAVGLRVLEASSGMGALAHFRERVAEIDVVILDLTMPHMDGVETFRELRRIEQDVPVILTSGYNEQDSINRLAGEGLAGFLKKPYDSAQLSRLVRRVMSAGAQPSASRSR